MVVQAKFRIGNPETFWRLQMVDGLARFTLSTAETIQVLDTYLDTKGHRLLAGGYIYRRREQANGLMMALATLSRPVGAIHRWEKWEILMHTERQPAKWPDSAIRTMLLQLVKNERLLPLAELQQTRIIRGMYLGEEQVAEVRLDSVDSKMAAKQQVHFEMEVDLIQPAREETLADIVDYLEDHWDLWPQQKTKFEQAYVPAANTPPNGFAEEGSRHAYRVRRIF